MKGACKSASAIMFLGTGSDVGKSIAATAFCRIFRRRGYGVAPFKAQNMSNNSYVTEEGGEIGRAQAVQAEAAGLLPSINMNPVLLKPSTETGAQIILRGEVFGQMNAAAYHALKPKLLGAVMDSYEKLAREYEIIVMEGAGSCCEMNLKDNDIVNFRMAKAAGARCILVADIDRGGVFAQIIGTYNLMEREEQDMTKGFIINKFRGDPGLFSSGIRYIREKTGKPVLGLVPFYRDIFIDSEDSVAVQEDRRPEIPIGPDTVNIAVVKFPSISNFTDLAALEQERDVVVNYLSRPGVPADGYDWVILPGAKNVMEDAEWLKSSGWTRAIRAVAHDGGRIIGLCGGYQLLGKIIRDPAGVESQRKEAGGIGLIPIKTVLAVDKVVRRVTGICIMNGRKVAGYEIHMGRSKIIGKKGKPFLRIHEPGSEKTWNDGWCSENGRIIGTYVHGILDMPGLRNRFLNETRERKGIVTRKPGYGRRARFHQYDRLADHFEAYCDVDGILGMI